MNTNKPAVIATVFVAIVAVVIAIMAIMKFAGDKQVEIEKNEEKNQIFIASDEVLAEMEDAATLLIKNNYTIVKLFYTIGFEHEDEPYGNLPEDGYYNAIGSSYASADEIYNIVRETFIESEAKKICEDPHGYGPLYMDKSNGRLGINAKFEPDYKYSVDWSSPSYVAVPVSNTECKLKITLKVNDMDVPSDLTMMKLNGKWLLDELLV